MLKGVAVVWMSHTMSKRCVLWFCRFYVYMSFLSLSFLFFSVSKRHWKLCGCLYAHWKKLHERSICSKFVCVHSVCFFFSLYLQVHWKCMTVLYLMGKMKCTQDHFSCYFCTACLIMSPTLRHCVYSIMPKCHDNLYPDSPSLSWNLPATFSSSAGLSFLEARFMSSSLFKKTNTFYICVYTTCSRLTSAYLHMHLCSSGCGKFWDITNLFDCM